MKSLIRTLIVSSVLSLSMILIPNLAHAEYVTIHLQQAGSYQNGCILFGFGAGNFNAGGNLVVDPTQPGAKLMLAVAMAALATGKSVTVDRESATPGKGPLPSNCWGISDYAAEIRLNSN